MLITDYLVGSDDNGSPLCLIVQGAVPLECAPGRSELVKKLDRHDLVQEFVQDGHAVEWVRFPDLPAAVVELLERGDSLTIIDTAEDGVQMDCLLTPDRARISKVGMI